MWMMAFSITSCDINHIGNYTFDISFPRESGPDLWLSYQLSISGSTLAEYATNCPTEYSQFELEYTVEITSLENEQVLPHIEYGVVGTMTKTVIELYNVVYKMQWLELTYTVIDSAGVP